MYSKAHLKRNIKDRLLLSQFPANVVKDKGEGTERINMVRIVRSAEYAPKAARKPSIYKAAPPIFHELADLVEKLGYRTDHVPEAVAELVGRTGTPTLQVVHQLCDRLARRAPAPIDAAIAQNIDRKAAIMV